MLALTPEISNSDQGSQYTMAQFIYGNGIGFRSDRVDAAQVAAEGYDSMWNPTYSGKLAVIDVVYDPDAGK